MVIVLPMYEIEQAGLYYNTAAVIDADGTYLGKYRKQHIPQVKGFWEKFYFRPGNGGYPVFDTAVGKVGVYICYDRHFPEGWRALGLNGAEIVFNPSATHRGLSEYIWRVEQPAAAVANMYYVGAINRVGIEADIGDNDFYGQSYFVDPRGQVRRRRRRRLQAGADRARPRHGQDQGGPRPLGVLPRPPPGRLRRAGRARMSKDADQERHRRQRHRAQRRADVLIDGETIAAVLAPGQAEALGVTADTTIDATGKYVIPGGIDVHTHMELPFGGTFASDTFETGTDRRGVGRRHHDRRLRRAAHRRERAATASPSGTRKADGNCAIDYGFHLIIGGVDDESLKAMSYLVDNEGITSFKLFMAYPGVLLHRRRPDPAGDADRRRVRRDDHDARRERHRHRRARRPGARPRRDRPEVPLLTRPAELEGEATNRAIVLGQGRRQRAAVHRAHVGVARRSRRSPRPATPATTCSPRRARSTST